MLKLKYLFDNRDLAKMLLENWSYDENSLEMFQYYRISSNAIYPFKSESKIRFIRFAPASEKNRENVLAELEFIQYLRSNDFPALKATLSNSLDLLVSANTPWGEYYASVFDRVPGLQIGSSDFNQNIIFEYGKTLGRLHKLSSEFTPTQRRWSYENVLLWVKEILLNHQNQEPALRELDMLHQYFSKMPKTNENFGLVHYDFELDNVFYDDSTSSCHVIDFDDAMYHWYGMDIEQALDSLKGELSPDAYVQSREYFLAGYKEEYPLSDETLSSLSVFRRFANLYAYARILRSSAEHWRNEPKWMVDLRVKLNHSMNNKLCHFGEKL